MDIRYCNCNEWLLMITTKPGESWTVCSQADDNGSERECRIVCIVSIVSSIGWILIHCGIMKYLCAYPCLWHVIFGNIYFYFDGNILFRHTEIFFYICTGCFYKLSTINLVWGPFKYSKSNFNHVHVFLHFKSFCLVVLKLILASKLSELQ